MLNYLKEDEDYCAALGLFQREWMDYFKDFDPILYSPILYSLIEVFAPNLFLHMNQLNIEKSFANVWFLRSFITVLPFHLIYTLHRLVVRHSGDDHSRGKSL